MGATFEAFDAAAEIWCSISMQLDPFIFLSENLKN
jgi:hypothetical protein